MQKVKNILIALRLNYSSNRSYLSGIARYLRTTHNWNTTVLENFYELSDKTLDRIVHGFYDGVITVPPHDDTISRKLGKCSVPLALLGSSHENLLNRRPNTVHVCSDDYGIGRLAARYLMGLGKFRQFAFVSSSPVTAYSERRFAGFAKGLEANKDELTKIMSPFPSGSDEDIACLQSSLLRLPKPVAVFTAYDQRAAQVLQACGTGGLSVPRDIEVLGVDNDLVFCEFSRPALSSIAINQVRKGEIAAYELNRLIGSGATKAKTILLKDAEVVERESTSPISPATRLVERALEFIEANAAAGIRPRDVVAHLRVSSALAVRRFRELEGKTIGEAITQSRMRILRSKLRTSKMTIASIVSASGFNNQDHAKRLFRKIYGMSMRDYRRQRVSQPSVKIT